MHITLPLALGAAECRALVGDNSMLMRIANKRHDGKLTVAMGKDATYLACFAPDLDLLVEAGKWLASPRPCRRAKGGGVVFEVVDEAGFVCGSYALCRSPNNEPTRRQSDRAPWLTRGRLT